MNRIRLTLGLGGWLVGLILVGSGLGLNPLASLTADAQDPLTESEVVARGEEWARGYFAETIGQQHRIEGRPVAFEDLDTLPPTYFEKTSKAVTSITSGVSFEDERDFWVLAWELDGASDGVNRGTSYIVAVISADSGDVVSANAGLRTPEQQALNRENLPSYDELFGRITDSLESETAQSSTD